MRDLKDKELRGRWGCRREKRVKPFSEQTKSCPDHEWIPELIPARLIDEETMTYEADNGFQFRNGREFLSSGQIAWLSRNDWQQDAATELVDEFDGEIEIL